MNEYAIIWLVLVSIFVIKSFLQAADISATSVTRRLSLFFFLTCQALKDSLSEGHNFLCLIRQDRELLLKSGKAPIEDNLLEELQQQWVCYQGKLNEASRKLKMLQCPLLLVNGKILDTAALTPHIENYPLKSQVIIVCGLR